MYVDRGLSDWLGSASFRPAGASDSPRLRGGLLRRADPASCSAAVVAEKDLRDAGGLFERGEVSGVRKGDRSGVTEQGEVRLTLRDLRPVVIAVDQGDGCGDATVE